MCNTSKKSSEKSSINFEIILEVFYFENKKAARKDRPHYWNNFLMSLRPFLRIVFDKGDLPLYKESNFHYDKIQPFEKINQPFKFFGYFQSYKYFQENYSQIRLKGISTCFFA